jgi:hypothetical protein
MGLRFLALSIRAPGPAAVRSIAVHERLFPRPTSPSVGPIHGGGRISARRTLTWTVPRGSSAPGSGTASCIRWST